MKAGASVKEGGLGLRVLQGRGFDKSAYNRSTGYYSVRCSQCSALVINGVPCHETGCPNKRKEDK